MIILVEDSNLGLREVEVADSYLDVPADPPVSPEAERDAMLLDLDYRLMLIENGITDLEV